MRSIYGPRVWLLKRVGSLLGLVQTGRWYSYWFPPAGHVNSWGRKALAVRCILFFDHLQWAKYLP